MKTTVTVWTCERCGDEYFTLRRLRRAPVRWRRGQCDRCGCDVLVRREITRPTPALVARAEYEDALDRRAPRLAQVAREGGDA